MLPCTPPQLHLVASMYGEAGGQFLQTLTFVNTSGRTCSLRGWPRLVDLPTQRVVQGKPAVRVVVRPRRAASFDIYGEDYDHLANKACPTVHSVRIAPPGSRASLSVRVRMPHCGRYDVAPVIAGRVDRDSWTTVAPPHGD